MHTDAALDEATLMDLAKQTGVSSSHIGRSPIALDT